MPRRKEEQINEMYENLRRSDKLTFIYFIAEKRIPYFYSANNEDIYFVWDKNNRAKTIFDSP